MTAYAEKMLDYMTHSIPILVQWYQAGLYNLHSDYEVSVTVFLAMLAMAED